MLIDDQSWALAVFFGFEKKIESAYLYIYITL